MSPIHNEYSFFINAVITFSVSAITYIHLVTVGCQLNAFNCVQSATAMVHESDLSSIHARCQMGTQYWQIP